MSSVTSLEALLLEAIRVGGSDICLSPFARRVMLGTWRNSIPDREEMVKYFRNCSQQIGQSTSFLTLER